MSSDLDCDYVFSEYKAIYKGCYTSHNVSVMYTMHHKVSLQWHASVIGFHFTFIIKFCCRTASGNMVFVIEAKSKGNTNFNV